MSTLLNPRAIPNVLSSNLADKLSVVPMETQRRTTVATGER